jgi:hypothetical protein
LWETCPFLPLLKPLLQLLKRSADGRSAHTLLADVLAPLVLLLQQQQLLLLLCL